MYGFRAINFMSSIENESGQFSFIILTSRISGQFFVHQLLASYDGSVSLVHSTQQPITSIHADLDIISLEFVALRLASEIYSENLIDNLVYVRLPPFSSAILSDHFYSNRDAAGAWHQFLNH